MDSKVRNRKIQWTAVFLESDIWSIIIVNTSVNKLCLDRLLYLLVQTKQVLFDSLMYFMHLSINSLLWFTRRNSLHCVIFVYEDLINVFLPD